MYFVWSNYKDWSSIKPADKLEPFYPIILHLRVQKASYINEWNINARTQCILQPHTNPRKVRHTAYFVAIEIF